METIHSIGVVELLEQLSFPSFFDRRERRAAYDLIMHWGDADERLAAEKAKAQYPFDEPGETLFPSLYEYDFPTATMARHS